MLFSPRFMLYSPDEPSADAAPSAPTQPASAPAQNVIDRAEFEKLQRSYSGLEGHAKDIKSKYDAMTIQHRDLAQQFEALRLERQTEAEQLTANLTTYKTQAEQAAAELARLTHEVSLSKMVLADYPELAPLYAKGLINTNGMDADGIKSYLDGLRETIGAQAKQMVGKQLSGTTPTPPSPDRKQGESVNDLYKQMMSTRPGTPEYAELQKAYFAALAAPKTP